MESENIMSKYPNRIPIICINLQKINNFKIKKLLVSNNFTIGQLIYILRKSIKLQKDVALFLFIQNNIPSNTSNIYDIYNEYKNNDGFLYIHYSIENTFGNKVI